MSRPEFDRAVTALKEGDTLVVTTLDRLGRSTANMLSLAAELRERGINLKVLNLGGGTVDIATPMGGRAFTVMAALAQMELDVKRELITDSVSQRQATGRGLRGRPRRVPDSQIRSAVHLVEGGERAAQVARDLAMSCATFYRQSRTLDG